MFIYINVIRQKAFTAGGKETNDKDLPNVPPAVLHFS